jgi:toxin secretion/phage lysis holin
MRIEFLQVFINAMAGNTFFRVLMVVIAVDTVLGVLRAIKFRQFNSSVGIDGAIRKVAMLASAVALMAADLLIHVNLMAFVPENYIQALGIQKLGMCEFFCLLFILYECLSVLKNMVLCGLPVPKKLGSWLKEFLENMTTEMPEEELDKIEQK